ncbi:glucan biosynthesis protein [Phenylobacterium sp.]|uniref:glucan biosynthesis protein n=1 Tax=Phenylobacterium sp. TaxID=1871053 RepID=UPI002F3E3BE7
MLATSQALGAPGRPARGADGWPTGAALGPSRPFSFEALKAHAAGLAARPYAPPAPLAPELLHAIDYDAFGQITYRPEAALWTRSESGGVRFFPMARTANVPVAMNVVWGGQARTVEYSPALFDMQPDSPARKLGDEAGFGGFRVMNRDQQTDWIAYLGASYFRSAEPFNQYGLSARGLAIDTATPRREEFPVFTSFWLEQDPDGRLVVYALLDGPSVAGAYRIRHQRSATGLVQDIEADLHFRGAVERLGVAPLTSMYWYGQSDRKPGDDWRPQIHDSDGLSIWTGAGERIWRPLANPPRVITNLFMDKSPRGFGLMQRDRSFGDYEDDGAFYDRRPSAWVEPVGDWGAGSVQLVEIPTAIETDDNVVAFWTPAASPSPGQALNFAYRLHWTADEPSPAGVARVVSTRLGRGGRPGHASPPGRRKCVIDFAGGPLAGLRRGDVEAVVDIDKGAPIEPVAYPVVGQTRWRLMFDIDAPAGSTVNLRAFLRRGGQALSETWIHQLVGPGG